MSFYHSQASNLDEVGEEEEDELLQQDSHPRDKNPGLKLTESALVIDTLPDAPEFYFQVPVPQYEERDLFEMNEEIIGEEEEEELLSMSQHALPKRMESLRLGDNISRLETQLLQEKPGLLKRKGDETLQNECIFHFSFSPVIVEFSE